MKRGNEVLDVTENPIYHDAWTLLKKYRDVVWSLELMEAAIETLRNRHKNGENYYWLLYYSFLSPQQLRNVDEV